MTERRVIPLDEALKNLQQAGFGMTKEEALEQGICIECKRRPVFYTEAGRREYRISGLCEPCFDALTKEDEDE